MIPTSTTRKVIPDSTNTITFSNQDGIEILKIRLDARFSPLQMIDTILREESDDSVTRCTDDIERMKAGEIRKITIEYEVK